MPKLVPSRLTLKRTLGNAMRSKSLGFAASCGDVPNSSVYVCNAKITPLARSARRRLTSASSSHAPDCASVTDLTSSSNVSPNPCLGEPPMSRCARIFVAQMIQRALRPRRMSAQSSRPSATGPPAARSSASSMSMASCPSRSPRVARHRCSQQCTSIVTSMPAGPSWYLTWSCTSSGSMGSSKGESSSGASSSLWQMCSIAYINSWP
mmetsp:Transcript_2871/g.8299  ORF Transcript_2871/g.8299 Transcript_2871/m.8299 type:complete len:208 (+) Transcript_2871:812-1435(+)